MSVQSSAKTLKGKASRHNQDSIYCNDKAGIWLVADGMGGHDDGREASQLICRDLPKLLLAGKSTEDSIRLCHSSLVASKANNTRSKGMGSTLVLVLRDDTAKVNSETIKSDSKPLQNFNVFWVGDSRAYIINRHDIRAITKDHSVVQNLIDLHLIDEKSARHHPERHLLTQCLGGSQSSSPQIGTAHIALSANDGLLLCSDGLHNELSKEEIYYLFNTTSSNKEIINSLLAEVERKKGRDDVSAILITKTSEKHKSGNKADSRIAKPINSFLSLFNW